MAQTPNDNKWIVSNHQGVWVPFSKLLICNERWSGRVPSDAWRVWWWMNNRMTGLTKLVADLTVTEPIYDKKGKKLKDETFEFDEGAILDIVAEANPLGFKEIAADLHCAWSSVQRSIKWLVSKGLLVRSRAGKGQYYRYWVLDSIRSCELTEGRIPDTMASDTVTEEELRFLCKPGRRCDQQHCPHCDELAGPCHCEEWEPTGKLTEFNIEDDDDLV